MCRPYIFILLIITLSCAHTISPDKESLSDMTLPVTTEEFNEYWYAGQAELSTYTLDQARYGDMHPGEVVMIFVTEDLLLNEQVKKEKDTSAPSTSVMKLNRIDRFTTGIYDYSTMLSTFSPVDEKVHVGPLKTTFSSQDWCGQSWMQVNHRENEYQVEVRSYFQSEGDREVAVDNAVLEDGLWTQMRLDPKRLPQGEFDILPSSQHIRLRHGALQVEKATGRLAMEVDDKDGERLIYSLTYVSGRQLTVFIQSVFPYRIFGWEEKAMSGYGASAKMRTTTATLKSSIQSPYWSKNSPQDVELRDMLKLD